MKIQLSSLVLIPILLGAPEAFSQTDQMIGTLAEEIEKSKELKDRVKLLVYANAEWTGEIHDGDYVTHLIEGTGNKVFLIPCGQTDSISVSISSTNNNNFDAYLLKDGIILAYSESTYFFQEQPLDCSAVGEFQIESESMMNSNYVFAAIVLIMATIVSTAFVKKYQTLRQEKKSTYK